MGDDTVRPNKLPSIYQSLQYQSVVSAALGETHCSFLTADGRILSWGRYSRGALGLEYSESLRPELPAQDAWTAKEVQFTHCVGREKDKPFCHVVAAAGFQTGSGL